MSITLQKNPDLKTLSVLDASGLTLSVYFALDQTNSEVNRIRLKNIIAQAQTLLEERVEDAKIVSRVTSRISELSEKEAFAKAKYAGLALLLNLEEPDELDAFGLSTEPENRVSLGRKPYLAPLIREHGFEPVTLLCIADNSLRLFRGRRGDLTETRPSEAFPENLKDVIRFELQAGLDGNELYRNKTSPTAHSSHGEGPTSRVQEEFERRYFRRIGQALGDFLNPDEKLFLAGVREKLALFRDENTELPVLDAELHGNFEEIETSILLEKANQVLAKSAQESLSNELRRARDLPPERRSTKPHDLLAAAEEGRIETLFLKHGSPPIDDQDTLVLQVVKKGGRVQIVDEPSWPDDALAVFRW